jgi:hypothetical protein
MNREDLQESPHLEQLANMPGEVAERKSCRLSFGFVGRNQERAESGTGEVQHSTQIDQDRLFAG